MSLRFITSLSLILLLTSCAGLKDFKSGREGNNLNMSRQGLTEFPEEAFLNPNLKVLRLYGNNIDSIPDRIGELVNLEKLYLGKNKIKYLPASIAKLKNLRILSVQYNDLLELSDSISGLVKLEQLLLNNNQLKTLPKTIGDLKKLEVLELKYNGFEVLPDEIGNCTELQFLKLNQNNMLEIPDSLTNCRKLRELYLSGSGPLLTLPEGLCTLRYFEVLEVDQIIRIPHCLLVQQTSRLSIIVR